MDKWLPKIAVGLSVALLVAVGLQQGQISDLERRVKAAEKAPEPGEPEGDEPTDRAAAGYDDSTLKARLAALEKRLDKAKSLRQAVAQAVAEKRPRAATAPGTAAPKTADEVSSLRADVDALLTGAGVQSPEGKEEVTSLVKGMRDKERQARRKRWTEFRKKSDAAFVKKFSEENDLDADTTEQVTTILQDMRQKQMKLWRGLRDGSMQYEEIASKRKDLRANMNAQLGEILTPKQLETFQKQRQERRRRGIF